MIPVLLTASIDTRGMKGAKFSAKDREAMYVNSLNFYIDDFSKRKGQYHLVFAENSGWDKKSVLDKLHVSNNVHVEYITLNYKDFDISKGKSYNEMLLIDKAIVISEEIKRASQFFKVTGRFPIKNIYRLMSEVKSFERRTGGYKFYCDCKDHNIYELLRMPINGHAGECRYYAVSISFYNKYFKGMYKTLNDYEGRNVESFFLNVIRNTKNMEGVHTRFKTQAYITGAGGHSLGNKSGFFYSTDYDSPIMKFKMGLRQILRWTLPFWKV